MAEYNFKKIEAKWQKVWEKKKLFQAKDFAQKPKKYILIEFPYPSGDGLHVGHVRSYSALDALARKKRMEGYNVLYPIGWDAFGLPTENYAIKKGIHPAIITKKNIANFTRQLKSLGLSFDWSREINTTDPEYYKWTQWIFLQFFKNDLAYQAEIPINWCPSCKIGLANEEVIDGKCERCGTETEKRKIKQWMLKITKYADRLLEDLKTVDYSDRIRIQQENWIGRSDGTTIKFPISIRQLADQFSIEVFTTRVDTIFGVTALVIAPEHEIIKKLEVRIKNLEEVRNYIKEAAKRSEIERTMKEKEKTGVKLEGVAVINPANGEEVPVFVGDYVIAAYGGGAVMVVPGHDKRDYVFAKKYELEIREVVVGGPAFVPLSGTSAGKDISKEAFVEYGKLVNSGQFDGLSSEEAIKKITAWLTEKGTAKAVVQYKLRDWIFSRQHYWGEPIPIIHCGKCGVVAVPEKDLPVKLPFVKKYKPTDTGESPLAAIKQWVNTKCPDCKGPAKRETDTMPNWAGSSWYFLRYVDPKNSKNFADAKKLKYWLPVDLYNGGMEHTTLHLLYSRFWHKFLYDLKLVPTAEPYAGRRSHGIVLAEDNRKMSKSFGNVINPDEVIKKFGADTLRVYEMFMGPHEQAISWSSDGVVGVFRFLNKIRRFADKVKKDAVADADIERILHKSVKKVSEDMENMKFNTAVSQLMILANEMDKRKFVPPEIFKIFLKILLPFAPHLSEELWSKMENKKLLHEEKWPVFDPMKIKEDVIEMAVQVNGKFRGTISVPTATSQNELEKIILSNGRFKKYLESGFKKVVFVRGKLINFVLAN